MRRYLILLSVAWLLWNFHWGSFTLVGGAMVIIPPGSLWVDTSGNNWIDTSNNDWSTPL
jgi:hypothetical protein